MAQTAIRPDQICPGGVCGTPDITWSQVGAGYQIGSTIPWRADSGTTPTFATTDAATIVELTNTGTFTVNIPDATAPGFGTGFGFTIQVKAGTVTLNHSGTNKISGQDAIVVGPYQSVNLLSRGGNWYAAVSAPVTAGAAPPTPATWDPTAGGKGANIVLSSSNMVATSGATGFESVRSTTSKTTGKVYFEISCDAINSGGGLMGGIENASGSLTSHVGSTANGVGDQCTDGTSGAWYYNGAIVLAKTVPTKCTVGSANRVHVAVDLVSGTKQIWSQYYVSGTGSGKWNDTAQAQPTTGGVTIPFSGPYFIAVSVLGTPSTTVTHLYPSTATIEGPVPTGYTVWDSAP